jgi:hypothetical protein
MKIRGIYLLLFLLLGACGLHDGRPNGVFIRVENNSDVNFKVVTVQSGSSEQYFGDVLSRSASDYREFEKAFRYGAIWLQAEGRDFSLIPIDYVGETPLRNGFYTYRIGLSSANITDANLTLELIRE